MAQHQSSAFGKLTQTIIAGTLLARFKEVKKKIDSVGKQDDNPLATPFEQSLPVIQALLLDRIKYLNAIVKGVDDQVASLTKQVHSLETDVEARINELHALEAQLIVMKEEAGMRGTSDKHEVELLYERLRQDFNLRIDELLVSNAKLRKDLRTTSEQNTTLEYRNKLLAQREERLQRMYHEQHLKITAAFYAHKEIKNQFLQLKEQHSKFRNTVRDSFVTLNTKMIEMHEAEQTRKQLQNMPALWALNSLSRKIVAKRKDTTNTSSHTLSIATQQSMLLGKGASSPTAGASQTTPTSLPITTSPTPSSNSKQGSSSSSKGGRVRGVKRSEGIMAISDRGDDEASLHHDITALNNHTQHHSFCHTNNPPPRNEKEDVLMHSSSTHSSNYIPSTAHHTTPPPILAGKPSTTHRKASYGSPSTTWLTSSCTKRGLMVEKEILLPLIPVPGPGYRSLNEQQLEEMRQQALRSAIPVLLEEVQSQRPNVATQTDPYPAGVLLEELMTMLPAASKLASNFGLDFGDDTTHTVQPVSVHKPSAATIAARHSSLKHNTNNTNTSFHYEQPTNATAHSSSGHAPHPRKRGQVELTADLFNLNKSHFKVDHHPTRKQPVPLKKHFMANNQLMYSHPSAAGTASKMRVEMQKYLSMMDSTFATLPFEATQQPGQKSDQARRLLASSTDEKIQQQKVQEVELQPEKQISTLVSFLKGGVG